MDAKYKSTIWLVTRFTDRVSPFLSSECSRIFFVWVLWKYCLPSYWMLAGRTSTRARYFGKCLLGTSAPMVVWEMSEPLVNWTFRDRDFSAISFRKLTIMNETNEIKQQSRDCKPENFTLKSVANTDVAASDNSIRTTVWKCMTNYLNLQFYQSNYKVHSRMLWFRLLY